MNMLILVNSNSNSGNGKVRWEKVEASLKESGVLFDAIQTTSFNHANEIIDEEIKKGRKIFIAAGGDGTTNSVLNSLMDNSADKPKGDIIFGAIGLGSSNDFHKPFNENNVIAGCPACISEQKSKMIDIGKINLETTDGSKKVFYFSLNASIGFVAESNAYFNTDKIILNMLKRANVELAILYTVIVNLIGFSPITTRLKLDDFPETTINATTIGILKKIHFAGGMYYDTPVNSSDGYFDVNVWEDMSRFEIISTIMDLYKGKFKGRKKTQSLRAKKVYIEPEDPAHLEFDGEIIKIRNAQIEVLPGILKICG